MSVNFIYTVSTMQLTKKQQRFQFIIDQVLHNPSLIHWKDQNDPYRRITFKRSQHQRGGLFITTSAMLTQLFCAMGI